MTRYLLDTNVVSESIRERPNPAVLAWIERHEESRLFISTILLAETWRGILEMPKGQKRDVLERWFRSDDGPQARFRGRIRSFDEEAALVWARLMAEGRALGRPRDATDMTIAAIAIARNCTLVTLNERDFKDVVAVVNPARSA